MMGLNVGVDLVDGPGRSEMAMRMPGLDTFKRLILPPRDGDILQTYPRTANLHASSYSRTF